MLGGFQSLLQKELVERRRLLQKSFHPVEGEFGFAKSSDGSSSEQIAEFLDESIKDGCEGLMVKRLTSADSTYEPSRRSINWLKVRLVAAARLATHNLYHFPSSVEKRLLGWSRRLL